MSENFEPCCSCKKYDIGYKQGRADAIDEVVNTLSKLNWDSIINIVDVSSLIKNIAEKLKEKK